MWWAIKGAASSATGGEIFGGAAATTGERGSSTDVLLAIPPTAGAGAAGSLTPPSFFNPPVFLSPGTTPPANNDPRPPCLTPNAANLNLAGLSPVSADSSLCSKSLTYYNIDSWVHKKKGEGGSIMLVIVSGKESVVSK